VAKATTYKASRVATQALHLPLQASSRESGKIRSRNGKRVPGRRRDLTNPICGPTSKPILVANHQFTKDVEARIARDFTARRVARESPGLREELREEVLRAAEGADALFFNPPMQLDGEFFRRLPGSVKVIATFSVGYDPIDLRAAAERGIPIANTPVVLTDATADLTMLLLGASRRAASGAMPAAS
jgi:hypothetical protein